MSDDFLHDQGKSLVEAFFVKENSEVLRRYQDKQATAAQVAELKQATGIQDEAALQHLAEKKISAPTIAAFGLYPLIAVAWADGKIDEAERDAILKAADQKGLTKGSPAYETLLNWLKTQPDPSLFDVWEEYAQALGKAIGEPHKSVLKQQTIAKAREVAEAAGGFLGIRSISDAEQKLLDRLDKSL